MAVFQSLCSSNLSPALQNLLLRKGICEPSHGDLTDNRDEHTNKNMFRDKDTKPDLDFEFDFEVFENVYLRAMRDLQLSEGFLILGEQNELSCRTDSKSTNPRYYECCVKHLSKIFLQSQESLSAMENEKFVEKYHECLSWTQNFKLFLEVHEFLALNDTSYDFLALLSLCVGLEKALGNLFLLKGSQVPTMLKDLLTTPELLSIIGYVPIQILQVVIGPPISMNLRNVAWHGFLAESELPRRYIYFLLLLTASIGEHLKAMGVKISTIPHRGYISLDAANSIGSHFEEITDEDLKQAEPSICASWIANTSNQNFFKTAFDLFRNGKYGCSSMMLFPLLEHSLRRLFVQVNDCPTRLITAETTEFFTTFEEILDNSLNTGQQNKIISSLTLPCMDLLHDLLVYPAGPRARDKLSHGEADYRCVNAALPKIIIIILAWLGREAVVEKEFKQKLERCFESYRSKFHPVALLQQKIIDLSIEFPKLCNEITLSPSLQPWNSTQGFDVFTTASPTLVQLIGAISKFATVVTVQAIREQVSLSENISSPFSADEHTVKNLMSSMKIQTLYRWRFSTDIASCPSSSSCENEHQEKTKRPASAKSSGGVTESEIIGLLMRIAEEAHISVNQTSETLRLRCQQLAQKELRSRQRDNLKRLLLYVPCAGLLVNYVVYIATWILSNLDNYSELTQPQQRSLQKQLKSTLQAMENIRTYTSSDKNKWSEAGELLLSEITSISEKLEKGTYFQNS